MLKINCRKPLVNFLDQKLYTNEQDRLDEKNPQLLGPTISNMLLLSKLESSDDPLEIYSLAKKLYKENFVSISNDQAKNLYDFISRSDIPTLIKGQILQELKTSEKQSLKNTNIKIIKKT